MQNPGPVIETIPGQTASISPPCHPGNADEDLRHPLANRPGRRCIGSGFEKIPSVQPSCAGGIKHFTSFEPTQIAPVVARPTDRRSRAERGRANRCNHSQTYSIGNQ